MTTLSDTETHSDTDTRQQTDRDEQSSASSSTSSVPTRQAAVKEPTNDSSNSASSKKGGGWLIYLISFCLMLVGVFVIAASKGVFDRGPSGPMSPTLSAIPAQYDSQRAFGYLKAICDIGPRPSGSDAMTRQQKMLQTFFKERGADVSLQTFDIRHPQDGTAVSLANLIASWNPTAPKRFLICAHYDTRPFPDRDRRNPRGVFVGANDGGSGTAGLMELANQMKDMPADVGVDLVAFDGEEFVFEQGRDDYFLGSTWFAEKYKASPPAVPYKAGVLLDMIGDRELSIHYEMNSLRFAKPVANEIWKTARRLGVRAFVPRGRHKIDDDHIPLNEIAKIPTIDVIDFDYPRAGFGAPTYWHTEQDVPENCSGQSIAAVVWVVHQWLKNQ